ncbi:MAG: PorT family protein [Candidatus Krumholzibacteriota bacterium]|nr:PorT family protein [Candidatus Krumholzibacteriota bacterium]
MKRLIIAVALIALLSGTALAEGMTFGVKAGVNLANLTGDDIDDVKMKLCFGGGVFMNYMMTESISLQPELLFMMKGTKADIDDDAGIKLSYIDIPILAKFAVPMEGAFAPCFFAGPYIGFNMSAKEYYEDDEEDLDDVKAMDFGLVFGGGFEYAMGEGAMTFDVRYALGLTTLDDSDAEMDVKNTGIMFLVGYAF